MGTISNRTGFAILRAARAWFAGKKESQFKVLEEAMAQGRAELDAKPEKPAKAKKAKPEAGDGDSEAPEAAEEG